MTHLEIIKKLIGSIEPAGDSSIDEKRHENLKQFCELFIEMKNELAGIKSRNDHAYQHSIKEMVQTIDYTFRELNN